MKFLQLGMKDFIKGLILTVITVVITGLYTVLTATPPALPTAAEWGSLGLMGMAAGVSYLIKNFLTSSEDKFLTKEPK